MLAIIGLLSVLVLALALNSLLRGNAQTPPAATSGAGEEGTSFEETALGENWVSSRPLPAARAGMAVASVGLNVYAIGGEDEQGPVSSVFIFDSQQQAWREGAQKLTAVTAAAAGVLEGEIYVAGGYGTNGEATTTVEAYSPLNNAWRPVTSLPRAMAGAVAAVSDGLLYLFGGEDGTQVLDEGYVYDPGTQQWLALPPLSTARTFAVGGALAGKLLVVGGSDGNEPLTVCEAYDPATEQWQACPELSQPRAAAGSASFLNKLYVVGGTEQMDVAAGDAPTGEVYDASLDAWSTFNMPMLADAPDWRYLGVSNVETHIYALGGERGGQMSDGLFIYRPLVHTYFIPAASAGGD